MRSLITSILLGVGALGITAATPNQAHASWLSEFLHRRLDPGYYSSNYYDNAPEYYAAPIYPVPVTPYYVPPTVYYGGPSYYPRNGDGHWRHYDRDHHHHGHHRR